MDPLDPAVGNLELLTYSRDCSALAEALAVVLE